MEISDEQRQALAALVRQRRGVRFNTKLAAYQAAGLNSATWSRIEAGQSVKEHKLRAAVRTLWPETGGDWTKVPTTSTADEPRGVEDRLADLEGRVTAIERYLRAYGEEGGGSGQQPAATNEAGSPRLEVEDDVSSWEHVEEPATPASTAVGPQPTPEKGDPALS